MRAKTAGKIRSLQGRRVSDALNASGRDLIALYRSRITTFNPGPVQDLTERTKRQKQREVGFVYPILYRTGQLMASMYHKLVWDAATATIRIGFSGHNGGTPNAVIAKAHLDGTATLPARDFTRVTQQWRRALMQRLKEAVRDANP